MSSPKSPYRSAGLVANVTRLNKRRKTVALVCGSGPRTAGGTGHYFKLIGRAAARDGLYRTCYWCKKPDFLVEFKKCKGRRS